MSQTPNCNEDIVGPGGCGSNCQTCFALGCACCGCDGNGNATCCPKA